MSYVYLYCVAACSTYETLTLGIPFVHVYFQLREYMYNVDWHIVSRVEVVAGSIPHNVFLVSRPPYFIPSIFNS